jgi:hypothetical protein
MSKVTAAIVSYGRHEGEGVRQRDGEDALEKVHELGYVT